VVSVDVSWGTEDGRDLIGWYDPKSNMDDMMEKEPEKYRSHIYLPHPAPYFPGEKSDNRDETRYNGGTYMAHRKYIEDIDKWNSDDFTITNNYGETFHGEDARNRAVGRDRDTGKVIREGDGELLEHEYDAAEATLCPLDSHILQARGGNPAPFKAPFPPLKDDEESSFHIQDIRIRRRGGNWRKIDPETGKTTFGLHFICFQNNIQQTGFEFINNIWLLNPLFRLNHDHILDPDKGIAEPIGGSYYFVPPMYREYPGEVFFK
jgi:deferrochelatase/peroxidase EfeB